LHDDIFGLQQKRQKWVVLITFIQPRAFSASMDSTNLLAAILDRCLLKAGRQINFACTYYYYGRILPLREKGIKIQKFEKKAYELSKNISILAYTFNDVEV